MKRFISILLAAVMSLAMVTTAFADNDPSAVLNATIEKNNKLESMDADMTIRASMYAGRESISLIMQTNIKMENLTGSDIRYLADAFMVMGESESDVSITENATIFYKDGYFYMDMAGMKAKYPMPLATIMQTAKQTTGTQFTHEQFKNVQMRQEGENLILSYELDAAQMNQTLGQMQAEMLGTLGMQINIKAVNGEYTVNPEGYCTAMKMNMAMDMTSEGETVTMVMAMDGTVNNPGQPVHIQFPSTEGYESLADYSGTANSGNGDGPASDH